MKKMDDDVPNAVIRILNGIATSAYFAKPELVVSITTRMVQLTFKNGLSKFSAIGFCAFGSHLCKNQDKTGFRFGQLGLKLAEKHHQAKELLSWVLICFYCKYFKWGILMNIMINNYLFLNRHDHSILLLFS